MSRVNGHRVVWKNGAQQFEEESELALEMGGRIGEIGDAILDKNNRAATGNDRSSGKKDLLFEPGGMNFDKRDVGNVVEVDRGEKGDIREGVKRNIRPKILSIVGFEGVDATVWGDFTSHMKGVDSEMGTNVNGGSTWFYIELDGRVDSGLPLFTSKEGLFTWVVRSRCVDFPDVRDVNSV